MKMWKGIEYFFMNEKKICTLYTCHYDIIKTFYNGCDKPLKCLVLSVLIVIKYILQV